MSQVSNQEAIHKGQPLKIKNHFLNVRFMHHGLYGFFQEGEMGFVKFPGCFNNFDFRV